MDKILSIYDRAVQPIESMRSNVNSKVIKIIIGISYMLIFLNPVILPLIFRNGESYRFVLMSGVILTGIIIILSAKSLKGRNLGLSSTYLYLMAFVGFLFMVHGIYFGAAAYIIIGFSFSIMSILYSVAISSSYELNHISIIASSLEYAAIIFVIVSIIIGPGLIMAQYTAITTNPNLLGNLLIIVVPGVLYRLYMCNSIWQKLSRYFFLSMLVTMCFFSNSRTNFLGIILELVTYGIFSILNSRQNSKLKKTKRLKNGAIKLIVVGLIALVTWFFTFFMLTDIKHTIANLLPSIQIEMDIDDSINFKESLEESSRHFTKGIAGVNKNEEVASGRVNIWKAFLKDVKLVGHQKEGKDLTFKDRKYKNTNAHNVYLQMAYAAGAPAGLGMIAIVLAVIAASFKKLYLAFNRVYITKDEIFAMMVLAGFLFPSFTSGGYPMYVYMPSTLFWMSLCIFSRKDRNNEKGTFNR